MHSSVSCDGVLWYEHHLRRQWLQRRALRLLLGFCIDAPVRGEVGVLGWRNGVFTRTVFLCEGGALLFLQQVGCRIDQAESG